MATDVVAARFLLLSGHLVATCLAADRQAADDRSAHGAAAMAFLGFAVALVALVTGIDMFSPSKAFVHVACHFLGGVMVCRQMLYDFPASYLWNVVAIAHVPTTACSIAAAVEVFVLRTARHSY